MCAPRHCGAAGHPRCRHGVLQNSLPRPISTHALVRRPGAARQPPGLPEHVDRHAAARMEIAADAQPARLEMVEQALADANRTIFMERRMIAEAVEKQLQ